MGEYVVVRVASDDEHEQIAQRFAARARELGLTDAALLPREDNDIPESWEHPVDLKRVYKRANEILAAS